MIAALFLTIPLLICMGYFFMGSLPLLVLNHDTPLDSRFIRGFFNNYYIAVACTGALAATSYALAGRWAFTAGLAAITSLALFLRKVFLPHMDRLRSRIETSDPIAITEFRRAHIGGMALNFVQLVAVIWGLFQVSR